MKKTMILLILLSTGFMSRAQIRVLPNGRMGVGTNTPVEKLHVVGGLHLSQGGNEFRFLPNNGGTEIGSNTGQIEFWYSSPIGHNSLKAKEFIRMSDRALKDDIKPIKDALQTVLNLQGVSYVMKNSQEQTPVRDYGFIAQEVEKIIKGVAEKSVKGYLGLDYDEIIPFLVEAVKEQQAMITEIQATCFPGEKSAPRKTDDGNTEEHADEALLFQNNPNPYRETTEIAYYLPGNTRRAELLLFDLQGSLVASHSLPGNGPGSFLMGAGALRAGMYYYTLVVDGQVVDTKKMILTE